MLTSIFVNNFRSLQNFSLEIQPGLNVLVGPNGSGKTNVIKWLEFLSLLGTSSLREAIGKIGGANHVFRRTNTGKYLSTLDFRFSGTSAGRNRFGFESDERDETPPFFVHYDFTAVISIIDNQIFFSDQALRVWVSSKGRITRSEKSINLDISWKYDANTDLVTSNIKINKPKSAAFRGDKYGFYIFDELKHMQNFLNGKHFSENMIMSSLFYQFDIISHVNEDLRYARAYNISPASVRSTLDISSQPGVQFDGAGVASTLYDLRVSMERRAGGRFGVRRGRQQNQVSNSTFHRITEYFKLSNSAIDRVDVDLDSFRNEFTLIVAYNFDGEEYTVPISLLSDGTVKWLAMTTAIATNNSAFCVEEPENFLHPKLQESIVSILRAEFNDNARPRFAIITTHSETLLNRLEPTEIIVTHMDFGRTTADRLDDPKEISKIINETGFGLGYFYVSGGF